MFGGTVDIKSTVQEGKKMADTYEMLMIQCSVMGLLFEHYAERRWGGGGALCLNAVN